MENGKSCASPCRAGGNESGCCLVEGELVVLNQMFILLVVVGVCSVQGAGSEKRQTSFLAGVYRMSLLAASGGENHPV